jgi:processive 1,2-diacylglycerol beta-glucosyltransferase
LIPQPNELKEGEDLVNQRCDVLILSASYGGGHNQVANALTCAMQLHLPEIRITTVDYCNLMEPFLNRLTHFSYHQSLRHFPVGYALYYQVTGKIAPDSFWQRRLNRMGYTELFKLINRLEPRVIVSTFPLPAGVLSQMKEYGDLNVPAVTVITDMSVHSQWIHPYTDLYIVGSKEVANGLIDRGIPWERIAVTGIPIMPAFSQPFERDKVRAEFGIRPDQKVVVFIAGNNGFFGKTKFHKIFDELGDKVQGLIITGVNQDLYEKLQAVGFKYSNLKILKYVQNMAGLLSITDVLITKAGGITISEALVKGAPMVIYKPIPGQEEVNANYLWRRRAAVIAKSEHRLRTAVHQMVTDERFRQRFERNCLKIAMPGSAESGSRLILDLLAPVTKKPIYYNIKSRGEVRA